jgi:hypothetical protein
MRLASTPHKAVQFVPALVLICLCQQVLAGGQFEDWNLEPAVAQAHLVMVARVASISRVTVVEGAKTDVSLREFRFQPVRVLKGVFQRDQLSMTGSDLGLSAEEAALDPPLKEGEFRLLVLVQRQDAQTFGCVSAAPGTSSFNERVALLERPDDPLVGVVETLIKVADSRSRRERAKLLVDRLESTTGLAAVPLLSSLKQRADWAAADGRAYAPLTRLMRDATTAVRGAALETLRDMLASRNVPEEADRLSQVGESLRDEVMSGEASSRARVAALDALGFVLALDQDIADVREPLVHELKGAATYAERMAAFKALSQIAPPGVEGFREIQNAFAELPLDETAYRELEYARVAVRLYPPAKARQLLGDLPATERLLLTRLERSMAADQSLAVEVDALGRLRSKAALPLLLKAGNQAAVAPASGLPIARALGRLADDAATPLLKRWLGAEQYELREAALAALEEIDSDAAAREVRPLLRSEPHLPLKLRMARLLARHGINDGYALAIEHLSDSQSTAQAALVLAALDDPRTVKDLSAIVAAPPDRQWLGAALTGLIAVNDVAARKPLQDILADDRHPLAAEAAQAVGLSADAELLRPLATLLKSRNRQIALNSLQALRRFLSDVRSSPRGLAAADTPAAHLGQFGAGMFGESNFELWDDSTTSVEVPPEIRAMLLEAVSSLALDAYVEPEIRYQALTVARLLGGDGYGKLLSDLADQPELEGTAILAEVQLQRRQSQQISFEVEVFKMP